MKKIIGLTIGGIIIILTTVIIYKYVYVPKNMSYRIKYINLKKEIKGNTNEIKGELTDNGFHTRLAFQKVNDSITYTFDILNDGSIPAKLFMDPIFIGKDNILKKNVTKYFTYIDGEEIKKGDKLNPGEKVSVQYKVIYTDTEMFSSADGNHFEVSILFPYLQNR